MKLTTKTLAIFVTTSTIALTAALAQPVITVDELGKGNFGGTPLPSGPKADPFSGIVTLAYQLPFPGTPGDVMLFEPGPQPAPPSDLMRFDGQGFLYFFSDSTDGPPFDPADVAQLPPPIASLPRISLLENGPEGNNGAFYNPAGGNPGDNTAGATYHFISDVPEPGSGLFLALGGGLLWMLKNRRQNKPS
jgi:hypothetical protein